VGGGVVSSTGGAVSAGAGTLGAAVVEVVDAGAVVVVVDEVVVVDRVVLVVDDEAPDPDAAVLAPPPPLQAARAAATTSTAPVRRKVMPTPTGEAPAGIAPSPDSMGRTRQVRSSGHAGGPRVTPARRRLAVGGIVGPAGFIGAWAWSGLATDGYSPVSEFISDLAALGAPHRPEMTAGFVCFGLAVPAYAIALRGALPGGAWMAATISGTPTMPQTRPAIARPLFGFACG